jgi:uncharacterized protein YndB with AHSA1/START domain
MATDGLSRRLDIAGVGDRHDQRFRRTAVAGFRRPGHPLVLLQWMHGPAGWWMVECDFDATEGGRYRYRWHGPKPARRSPPRSTTMKSDTVDVVSTREFAAPVAQVWRAWSDPDYLTQWWGPSGFTAPSPRLDFRIGGTSLVCMRAPAEYGGQDMYNTWTYRRIEPMTLIEFDNRFTDRAGASIPPPPGVPSEVRHLVTFTSVAADRTSMTVTEFGYPDEQVRDQSKAGLEQCLDKMAALLAK